MSQQGGGAQEAMQKFGRFLSGMVMPNIGAFIAWGFLTALFIPTGWMPNEYLAQVGGPMSKWLIPLLIGYSGGAAVYGDCHIGHHCWLGDSDVPRRHDYGTSGWLSDQEV